MALERLNPGAEITAVANWSQRIEQTAKRARLLPSRAFNYVDDQIWQGGEYLVDKVSQGLEYTTRPVKMALRYLEEPARIGLDYVARPIQLAYGYLSIPAGAVYEQTHLPACKVFHQELYPGESHHINTKGAAVAGAAISISIWSIGLGPIGIPLGAAWGAAWGIMLEKIVFDNSDLENLPTLD